MTPRSATPSTGVSIRHLVRKDAAQLAERVRQVSEFLVNPNAPDAWTLEDLEAWLLEEGELCSGAFLHGTLVGFCLAHLHRATCKLHIENIFVMQNYQRARIAARLLSSTIDCAQRNCRRRMRVVALVRSANEKAQAFFANQGLQRGEAMLWYQENLDSSDGPTLR